MSKSQGPVMVRICKHTGSVEVLGIQPGLLQPWMGPGQVRRVSHIEPANRLLRWLFHALRWLGGDFGLLARSTRNWPCLWQVNLKPSRGPLVGPFGTRRQALQVEVEWLSNHHRRIFEP